MIAALRRVYEWAFSIDDQQSYEPFEDDMKWWAIADWEMLNYLARAAAGESVAVLCAQVYATGRDDHDFDGGRWLVLSDEHVSAALQSTADGADPGQALDLLLVQPGVEVFDERRGDVDG